MKNDDQMYQSVLSRRDAYRLKKQKRIRTVKRLTPMLACFCFTVVLGLGVWQHRANLPHVPVKPETETTATTGATTTAAETTITAVSETSQTRQTRPTTSATVQTETVTEVSATVITAMTTVSPQTALQTHTAATIPAIVTQPDTYRPETAPPVKARITPQISTMEIVTTAAAPPTTTETPSTTTAETTEPTQPEPPPQEPVDIYVAPLHFNTLSKLTDMLTKNDVSSYEEADQSAYRKVFDRFLQDGFVYELLDTNSISRIKDRDISLYPYARFEDIGIGYAVNYCDKFYYVTFYSADTAYLGGSISDYLQARMKRQTDKEITVQEQTVSVVFANGGQIVANTFVDDSHYLNVRTAATEEELTAFLNEISYEQRPIE